MYSSRVGYLAALILTITACNGTEEVEPVCEAPLAEEPECVDDMILDLGLQESVSTGAVTTEAGDSGFVTEIDATAGGFGNTQNNPWTYVVFTDEGAERVDIDDEAALSSMEWHIAAKRYNIRVNSGSSGVSCVGAAPLLDRSYDDVTAADIEGVTFNEDDFYTPDCTLINDSSGLEGNPQVALGAWWSYSGCVKTSGIPFLVQLDNGRVLKLEVQSYYSSGQEACNTSDAPGEGSGNLTMRWDWVQ